jgi:hypothetical protein
MFLIIVDTKGPDPRTFVIEADSLSEAEEAYWGEVDQAQMNGMVVEIEVVEVARFIDFT